MAKKAYIGDTSNKARKVKKIYLGDINEKARKVKKGYIGIGGVARPFFSGGEVTYYGAITDTSEPRHSRGTDTAVVGDYALVAGSHSANGQHTYALQTVDAYDKSLTKHSAPQLYSYGVYASTTVGNYALFYTDTGMEIYDSSLTKQFQPVSTSMAWCDTATTVGSYGIFMGYEVTYGEYGVTYPSLSVPFAYTEWLTQTSVPSSIGLTHINSTTIGDYALFGPGRGYNSDDYKVDAYNASLTLFSTTPTDVSIIMAEHYGATTVGDYALFGTLDGGGTPSTRIEVYNKSLTRLNQIETSEHREGHDAVTLGEFAIFAGGDGYERETPPNGTDVFDTNLTRTTIESVKKMLNDTVAMVIGEYALIIGGTCHQVYGDPYTTNVEAFVLA